MLPFILVIFHASLASSDCKALPLCPSQVVLSYAQNNSVFFMATNGKPVKVGLQAAVKIIDGPSIFIGLINGCEWQSISIDFVQDYKEW